MKTLRLLLLSLCMGCVAALLASGYSIYDLPSPKMQGQDCYVANPDAVLHDSTVQKLNDLCANLYDRTKVEMAVVAIKDYAVMYADAYSFSLKLFNHWGIGDSETNTGVLVFLCINSREVQIITGSGIEGILTDLRCGEILDNNIEPLRYDDWDVGVTDICVDIYQDLNEPDTRAELLFGWKPKKDESESLVLWYFAIAYLLLVLLARYTYKKTQPVPGVLEEDMKENSEVAQVGTGCLSWLFPIPLLFLYLYIRYLRKHLCTQPLQCKQCGHDMVHLEGEEKEKHETEVQLFDDKLNVRTYRVWHCPECPTDEAIAREGAKFDFYKDCPTCHARALKRTDSLIIKAATYESSGIQLVTRTCAHCGMTMQEQVVLPMLVRPIFSSSDSDSNSSSRSSSSSSSRSSSSWGGGRSSGGGAGRRF